MLSLKNDHAAPAQPARTGVGRLSLLALGAWFVVPTVIGDLVAALFPSLLLVAGVVQLALLIALLVIVARHRDDDLLEAGVLVAVITGVAQLVVQAIAETVAKGTIWAGVVTLPSAFIGLLLRAVIVGAFAAGLVWLIRLIFPVRAASA